MKNAALLLLHVLGMMVAKVEYCCAAIQKWIAAVEQWLNTDLARTAADD